LKMIIASSSRCFHVGIGRLWNHSSRSICSHMYHLKWY
jgi:hypothetical protein